jgi:hypothetical protein
MIDEVRNQVHRDRRRGKLAQEKRHRYPPKGGVSQRRTRGCPRCSHRLHGLLGLGTKVTIRVQAQICGPPSEHDGMERNRAHG